MKLLNSFSIVFLLALFSVGCSNVSNFTEQGGARTVIEGDLDIASGGEIDLESGSTLKWEGSAVDLGYDGDDGVLFKRVLRATYDFAVDGGATGTIDLGQDLPANALITKNWTYVVTQVTDGGAGTVAFECEDSENLYSATDISGQAAGSVVAGAVDGGSASTYLGSIAATCNVSMVIGGAAITAGKLLHFIEYVVTE